MEIIGRVKCNSNTVLVFSDEKAVRYCQLPLDVEKTIIGERTIKYGVFYNKEMQIIGLNTLNDPNGVKLSEKELPLLFLKIYMITPNLESFVWDTSKSDLNVYWWNNERKKTELSD